MDSPFRWRMAHVWGCPDIDTHDGPTQQPTTIRPMPQIQKKMAGGGFVSELRLDDVIISPQDPRFTNDTVKTCSEERGGTILVLGPSYYVVRL